jgi:hypothetical protein
MRLLLGLSILLALYPLVCRAESCGNGVRANGETIELSGVLHRKVFWGPPNFGDEPETDSKFALWIISLRKPLIILKGAQIEGPFPPSVSEIKLAAGTTMFKSKLLRPLHGKLVVVTGKLWLGITPGDAPIAIFMKTIKRTDQHVCRVIPGN